jgi:hypothetical protein
MKQHCWEKSDQQIPAVEEEHEPYQVESTFTHEAEFSDDYNENKYLTQVDNAL